MNKLKLLFLTVLFTGSLNVCAQTDDAVLFTVDKDTVMSSEFMKVFNKNREIVAEENKKSINEYLALYIKYKLKLKEAFALKYDTVKGYQEELNAYKEQLISPYLTDSKVTRRLVKEAYERSKFDINASNILVLVAPNANPADTLKAYKKIENALAEIHSGASFEAVAKKYSEDPSAQANGGNLGYFSVFSMVYPFESAAYSTPVSEVSAPFRTSYGYHIVKVNDKRPSEGEVQVAHIMIKNHQSDSLEAKVRIGEIYQKLRQNGHFELMAKQQSDDRNSAINGGVLPKFNRTRMIEEFANAAFSLKEPNELSEPIKTGQGWHIIKLIEKFPVGEFKEVKDELSRQIEQSERAKIAGKSVLKRLKSTYKINYNQDVINAYLANHSTDSKTEANNVLVSINEKSIPFTAFKTFSMKSNLSGEEALDQFFNQEILTYFKDNLINTEPEYAFTLKDYKEGLLLFDIMQDKVWGRAERDSIGLRKFYEENAHLYQWGKRAALTIAHCTTLPKAKAVRRLLKQGKSTNEIKTSINEGPTIHVLLSSGILGEGDKKLPENFKFDKIGVTEVLGANTNYTIVKISDILQPEQMSLADARGAVINDYQKYLEESWVNSLRNKHTVTINTQTLHALIRQNEK